MPPYAGTFAKPENALKRAVRFPAMAAARQIPAKTLGTRFVSAGDAF
jgi:hypothetical protein